MHAEQQDSTDGDVASIERSAVGRSELDELRATCQRQAHVIDALSGAVTTLRRGAQALKAENADLRAETKAGRARRAVRPRAERRDDGDERTEARFALDVHAPAAARSAVADCLRDRVAPVVLGDALLVTTELVTNSVRHSAAQAGTSVTVGVTLSTAGIRLDVDDPGHSGAVAPRPPDRAGTGGFGLNIVQTLSERWGVERAARGGTRVWAELPRSPLTALGRN